MHPAMCISEYTHIVAAAIAAATGTATATAIAAAIAYYCYCYCYWHCYWDFAVASWGHLETTATTTTNHYHHYALGRHKVRVRACAPASLYTYSFVY